MGEKDDTGNMVYFDDEEREMIEAFERDFDPAHAVSHLTPERKAELQAMARATLAELRAKGGGEA